MNWEKLKVFKKVAKAGSFLTASKQDNKSQSTFSRAVMDLEKEINQKITLANEYCQGNGISLNYWSQNANN